MGIAFKVRPPIDPPKDQERRMIRIARFYSSNALAISVAMFLVSVCYCVAVAFGRIAPGLHTDVLLGFSLLLIVLYAFADRESAN